MEFALARGAAVWRGLERGIDTFSLENVISLRSRAADLRRSLDTVIMHADRRTDQLCRFAVSAVFDFCRQILVAGAGRSNRLTGFVIDDLAVNMFVAAVNA